MPEERPGRVLRLEPIGRMALVVHREGALVQAVVVGHDHAAVAARDRLELVEAERAGRPEAADAAALVGRAEGLGAVLDERDAVTVGDRLELVDPGRAAEHVDDQDAGRARRDLRLDVGRIEIEGLVDLGQDRRRARVHDRGDRGDVREARDDDLVAGADAQAEERDPQRGRAAAVEGERVLHAGQLGDGLLDVMHLCPEGRVVGRPVAAQVAALEDLHHLGGLLGSDQLDPGSGHGRLPRYWMSIRCSRRFLS